MTENPKGLDPAGQWYQACLRLFTAASFAMDFMVFAAALAGLFTPLAWLFLVVIVLCVLQQYVTKLYAKTMLDPDPPIWWNHYLRMFDLVTQLGVLAAWILVLQQRGA